MVREDCRMIFASANQIFSRTIAVPQFVPGPRAVASSASFASDASRLNEGRYRHFGELGDEAKVAPTANGRCKYKIMIKIMIKMGKFRLTLSPSFLAHLLSIICTVSEPVKPRKAGRNRIGAEPSDKIARCAATSYGWM
jgi:hypothetical protein